MNETGFALRGESVESIARSLRERGPGRATGYGIERIGAGALGVVEREVAEIVRQALSQDVGDLLVGGWKTYSRLMTAARRSVKHPGRKEEVVLGAHTVTWTYEPKVEVLVDGKGVNTLEFVLTVDFELEPLVLEVRDGYLEAVAAGRGSVTTLLTLEGWTILPTKETPIEDLTVLVPLRKPIRLVSSATRPDPG
jgi:hypothetical protein